MSTNLTSIDITTLKPSDLLRIAEEVQTTKTPRILKRDREPVAMLMPIGTAVHRRHPQKRTIWTHYNPTRVKAALKVSAGALQGVDREALLSDLANQRSQESTGRMFQCMPYLIDTDLVIDHLANLPQAHQLLDTLAPGGIAISIITYMEAYQGVVRSSNVKEARAKFQVFRRSVPVLPFSLTVAKRCASLRVFLAIQKCTTSSKLLTEIPTTSQKSVNRNWQPFGIFRAFC